MLSQTAAFRKDTTTSTTLQHRHFAFIAQTISTMSEDIRADTARHFADALAKNNMRFDRARFLKAAGVE